MVTELPRLGHMGELPNLEWGGRELRQISTSPPIQPGNATSCNVAVNDLQPSGVLNHRAMKGTFSLQSLLNSSERESQAADADTNTDDVEDPVLLGLVNTSIAKSLYDR